MKADSIWNTFMFQFLYFVLLVLSWMNTDYFFFSFINVGRAAKNIIEDKTRS